MTGRGRSAAAAPSWGPAIPPPRGGCCPHTHRAIELIGKRWSGAIVLVLLDGPRRFGEIGEAVPALSDRLLAERVRELEAHGLVRREAAGRRAVYALTPMGEDLAPALREVRRWALRWLA